MEQAGESAEPRPAGRASDARARLLRDGTLRWFHWVVVAISLLVTVAAWWIAEAQRREKNQERFDRETEAVVRLLVERLLTYEDALWGGVGVVKTQSYGLTADEWRAFAKTISLDVRYPGLNGVGVITRVPRADLPGFLAERRAERPDYAVFPAGDAAEHLPVTFIEPLAENARALGMDFASEAHRAEAIRRARDTGQPQITGPIELIQDTRHQPAFSLFVPFYRGAPAATTADRQRRFAGAVYAPVILARLMEGLLQRQDRHVEVRIADEDVVMYDERGRTGPLHDDAPMFHARRPLDLYGRTWQVDIWTDRAFRAASASAQPLTVLVAGLAIDALLLTLFIALSRVNRRAIEYADLANAALADNVRELARSNRDLEQFAYVAAHDLQEPLRMVASYCDLIERRYGAMLDAEGRQFIDFAVAGATRMQALLEGLMQYSRVATGPDPRAPVDCGAVLADVLADLELSIQETGATVHVGPMPTAVGDAQLLRQVFQNLVANALKFRGEAPPVIEIAAESHADRVVISVKDNGIGMNPAYTEKIFTIFQRLNARDAYPGQGVGLAVAQRIMERHGGRLWVESALGAGSTFFVELPRPKAPAARPRRDQA